MSYSAADAYAAAPSTASPTRPAPVQQPRYSTGSGARPFDAGDYEARAGTASRSSAAKHAGPAQAWREESESEGESSGCQTTGLCARVAGACERSAGQRHAVRLCSLRSALLHSLPAMLVSPRVMTSSCIRGELRWLSRPTCPL